MRELDEIRERWEKATKGPYDFDSRLDGKTEHEIGSVRGWFIKAPGVGIGLESREFDNVEFLAHSWQDVKTLLELVDRAQGHLRLISAGQARTVRRWQRKRWKS